MRPAVGHAGAHHKHSNATPAASFGLRAWGLLACAASFGLRAWGIRLLARVPGVFWPAQHLLACVILGDAFLLQGLLRKRLVGSLTHQLQQARMPLPH